MAGELTETPSPQPAPVGPGAEVRMSRLHEALKQLKAKGSMPLSAIQAELALQQSVPATSGAEANAAPASMALPVAEAASHPPGNRSSPTAVNVADTAESPVSPAIEPAVTEPSVETVAQQLAMSDMPSVTAGLPSRPFRLEDWTVPAQLQRFRQLADKIASQSPHGLPMALALAAAAPWQDLTPVANRLAICLAERDEGEVLLIEHDLVTRGLTKEAPTGGLADLAAERVQSSQAIVPTSAARLSVLGADSATSQEDAPLGEQWRSTIRQLKQRFRFILAVVQPVTGPVPWLASFDAVYLAVILQMTARDAAQFTLAQLKSGGAAVCGCIALD